jgi:Alpha/beta hydrolase family
MTAAVPVWFGSRTRPLFGWFHAPLNGRARSAVVVCSPFAHEHTQAQYTLRLLGEQLAASGICVLRFDYDGMGDSAGGSSDPNRVAGWLGSIATAIAYVRRFGCARVSMVGMRIGATLAAQAAAEDGAIDQLVLWDPCASGGAFLREQQVAAALTLGATPTLSDGSTNAPGMIYGPATARAMRRLRLDETRGVAKRVLVLTRPRRDLAKAVMERLATREIEHDVATDQDALMDVGPPFQRIPHASIERVATWLSTGSGTDATPVQAVVVAGAATVDRAPTGAPIIERPLFIEPAGLFAMVSETPDSRAGRPVAIFLNVANEHHIGPGRIWVDLSRRWAALGVRSVRLDMSGLGESPVRHPDQPRFVARAPESFTDVTDAVRAVVTSPSDPVVLVGLCSSAYQAIDSALELRPAALVAVNPVLRFVPAELMQGLPLDRRRTAVYPRKVVTTAFRNTGPFPALRQRFPGTRRRLRLLAQPGRLTGTWIQKAMGLGWRARLRLHPRRRPAKWLRTLVDGRVDVMIVAGELEARPIRFGTSPRQRAKLERTGRFRFEYIPDLEHGLLTGAHRGRVADLLTAHIADRFLPGAPAERATTSGDPERSSIAPSPSDEVRSSAAAASG